MKKKYILAAIILAFIGIVIVILFKNEKEKEVPQPSVTLEQTVPETTETTGTIETTKTIEYETIASDNTEDGRDQNEVTDDEKFDLIYLKLQEKFGKEFAPMHYTKSGLNDELKVTLSAGVKILDCRNKDNSNVVTAFSFNSEHEKSTIKAKLTEHKSKFNETSIVYEVDHYLFFISLEQEGNETAIKIIDEIIR